MGVYRHHNEIEKGCDIDEEKQRTVNEVGFGDCENMPCEYVKKVEKGKNRRRYHKNNKLWGIVLCELLGKGKCIEHEHCDKTYLHHIENGEQYEIKADGNILRILCGVGGYKVERNIENAYENKGLEKFVGSGGQPALAEKVDTYDYQENKGADLVIYIVMHTVSLSFDLRTILYSICHRKSSVLVTKI